MSLPAALKQCEDYLMFQETLKQTRTLDDKIIYALNNSIPTASFKGQIDAKQTCKDLFHEINQTYDLREGSLVKCIKYTQDKVEKAKESGDRSAQRQAQTTLRLFKNELSVEEVIRERTQRVFYEKCRQHFTEGQFKSTVL